ncbi:MAG: sigma-70 family RNA polymerase sigma factor [Verrucomicrobia bacterium]|nr:sigma-70 family RNA polymerase sigma factor [Verrucomicrobiota bacterium]MCH8511350.1 sigma-70 family RNA polymerase sigma factor [Kiritimatiellia bacterium]
MPETPELNPSRWLHEHGDILYRFALGRVRNPQVAEDLLQDTFLAAIKGADGFSGRSAERTWLVGILKHKIIDYYRKSNREMATETPGDHAVDHEAYLDRKGRWKVGQSEWITNPEKAYEREEFWLTLNQCLSKLNDNQRRVFELRELEHLNAEEICDTLDISSSNLWVLLHRARLQLKDCLEINWVNQDQKNG